VDGKFYANVIIIDAKVVTLQASEGAVTAIINNSTIMQSMMLIKLKSHDKSDN
jgi:glutamine cyclotransferase